MKKNPIPLTNGIVLLDVTFEEILGSNQEKNEIQELPKGSYKLKVETLTKQVVAYNFGIRDLEINNSKWSETATSGSLKNESDFQYPQSKLYVEGKLIDSSGKIFMVSTVNLQ